MQIVMIGYVWIVFQELVDLPLGVLTALIGTPVFVMLLVKTRKEWV